MKAMQTYTVAHLNIYTHIYIHMCIYVIIYIYALTYLRGLLESWPGKGFSKEGAKVIPNA